ncbi:MAG: hypothetical protein K0R24_1601 [Gammaproteobacteria bacterium]|nr:hypothetical protein [Gammaproteobacteria bacterium]
MIHSRISNYFNTLWRHLKGSLGPKSAKGYFLLPIVLHFSMGLKIALMWEMLELHLMLFHLPLFPGAAIEGSWYSRADTFPINPISL